MGDKEWLPRAPSKKADWIRSKIRNQLASPRTEGVFPVFSRKSKEKKYVRTFPCQSFCGEASRFPVACPYLISFLGRGSEAIGLPVAGAVFRPQEVERVNRNKRRKRQRTAAPIEVTEGAVKKHISSSEEAEITVRSMVFFASLCWRRCKWTACFCPIHTAFLEGARGNRSLAYKERFPRKYLVFVFSQPRIIIIPPPR